MDQSVWRTHYKYVPYSYIKSLKDIEDSSFESIREDHLYKWLCNENKFMILSPLEHQYGHKTLKKLTMRVSHYSRLIVSVSIYGKEAPFEDKFLAYTLDDWIF